MRRSYLTQWLALAVVLLVWSPAAGQQPGRGPGGIDLRGPLELLARPDVRQELELVGEQLGELSALRESLQQQRREVFSEIRQMEDPREARQRIGEALREFNVQVQEALQKILLPHQLKRLNQLQLQRRLRGGSWGAFASPQLAEQLGISEQQRADLRDRARELELELRKKIAQLRREAQQQLLAGLTAEQRERFRDLIGEPFDFQQEDPPPRSGRDPAGTP